MIRIEFWNGQLNKKNQLVKTKHNPCLWANVDEDNNPWRSSYVEALKVIDQWSQKQLSDSDFLHHIRFVAYGLNKRDFNDSEVIWPGNMTSRHKPKLVVETEKNKFTIYFNYQNDNWVANMVNDEAIFYWSL